MFGLCAYRKRRFLPGTRCVRGPRACRFWVWIGDGGGGEMLCVSGVFSLVLWWFFPPGRCLRNLFTPYLIFSIILGVWRDVSELFNISSF